MGNEEQWGQDQSVEHGEPPGNHLIITLKRQALEEVESFSYLGSEVEQTSRVEIDVKIRIEKGASDYQMWRRKVFRSRKPLAEELHCRFFTQWSCQIISYTSNCYGAD